MKNGVKNWIDSAFYDLETAEHMFRTERYIYTVFMCHLSLEKIFKAKVEEQINKMPPKVHDLLYLAQMTNLSLPEDIEKFLAEVSNLSIVTRYPGDFQQAFKDFSKERSESILIKAKEVFQWIKKSITA